MVALIAAQTLYISQPLHTLTNNSNKEGNMVVDDEDSTSSTISCLLASKQQQQQLFHTPQQPLVRSCSSSSSNRRRVRFADTVTYHDSNNNSTDDLLWYTAEDYQFFRHSTLNLAQRVIDTEHRNRAPHSYQRVLERIYTRYCCTTNNNDTIPAHELVHLQRWVTAAPQRWGLEKWCIRSIAHDRGRRRKATVTSVQVAYAAMGPGKTRFASLQWSQASVQLGHVLALGLAGSLEREDGHRRL